MATIRTDDDEAAWWAVAPELTVDLDPATVVAGPAPRPAAAPGTASRRVRLEVPDDTHLPALWHLVADPDTSFRWRHHGRVPTPRELAETLWDGVPCQFVAVDRRTGEPVVWCIAYNLNPRDQYAFVAVHGWPAYLGSMGLLDGVFLFFRHLFATFPLRKLYAEVREFNLTQFASGAGRFFEIEGRLREHAFHDGQRWDQFILALTAERFAEVEERFGRRWFPTTSEDDPEPGPPPGSDRVPCPTPEQQETAHG